MAYSDEDFDLLCGTIDGQQEEIDKLKLKELSYEEVTLIDRALTLYSREKMTGHRNYSEEDVFSGLRAKLKQ